MDHLESKRGPFAGQIGRTLRLFSLYRIFVPAALLTSTLFDVAPPALGQVSGPLFLATAIAWLAVATVQSAGAWRGRGTPTRQAALFATVDIAAITAIAWASGGGAGGFGILLIPAIAGVGILIQGRTAALFAAFGAIALLGAEIHGLLFKGFPVGGLTQTGLIGAALFATATLSWVLARRARESEEIAARRGADLADMERINASIIERMESGVLVVDRGGLVRFANDAARRLFGTMNAAGRERLADLSPPLDRAHRAWLTRGGDERTTLLADGADPEIQARITPLGSHHALIFAEDTEDLNRRLQEVKLASLGRLTASISHEIRNPLGAISHAAQLLGESESIDGQDRRLTAIIHDQSQRMNRMIQGILGLSRRQAPRREEIALAGWLNGFADEFRRQKGEAGGDLEITVTCPGVAVRFDPDHLHQILWNLCTNALRHGRGADGRVTIELIATINERGRVALDVADDGPGIDPAMEGRLFEPFATASREGIGLGLYISRELCENNGGELLNIPAPEGSRFRIRFPA